MAFLPISPNEVCIVAIPVSLNTFVIGSSANERSSFGNDFLVVQRYQVKSPDLPKNVFFMMSGSFSNIVRA